MFSDLQNLVFKHHLFYLILGTLANLLIWNSEVVYLELVQFLVSYEKYIVYRLLISVEHQNTSCLDLQCPCENYILLISLYLKQGNGKHYYVFTFDDILFRIIISFLNIHLILFMLILQNMSMKSNCVLTFDESHVWNSS